MLYCCSTHSQGCKLRRILGIGIQSHDRRTGRDLPPVTRRIISLCSGNGNTLSLPERIIGCNIQRHSLIPAKVCGKRILLLFTECCGKLVQIRVFLIERVHVVAGYGHEIREQLIRSHLVQILLCGFLLLRLSRSLFFSFFRFLFVLLLLSLRRFLLYFLCFFLKGNSDGGISICLQLIRCICAVTGYRTKCSAVGCHSCDLMILICRYMENHRCILLHLLCQAVCCILRTAAIHRYGYLAAGYGLHMQLTDFCCLLLFHGSLCRRGLGLCFLRRCLFLRRCFCCLRLRLFRRCLFLCLRLFRRDLNLLHRRLRLLGRRLLCGRFRHGLCFLLLRLYFHYFLRCLRAGFAVHLILARRL